MATGTVKWFNNQKGYGFICPITDEEGKPNSEVEGEEIFAHFSAIVMEGYKTLKAGQSVDFEIQQGDKGNFAMNIKPSETGT